MRDPHILTEIPEACADDFIHNMLEEYYEGFRRTMAMKAALELSIFGYTRSPVTSADVSDSTGWDDVMTRLFLDCLVSMGLLEFADGRYCNSVVASTLLDPESPRYQGINLGYGMDRLMRWSELGEAVCQGPKVLPVSEVFGDTWIRAIGESAAGGSVAKILAEVESAVDLPEEGRFLDLGGGHGLYTVAFCTRHPGLKGYVFDRPEMVQLAEENFAEYGCDAGTISGDFYVDDLGGLYDVVFSSFNHSVSDITLCEKVRDAVAPGGLLIMRRHVYNGDPDPIRLLEWNIAIREGIGKGCQRFNGSWLPSSSEYVGCMEALGMEMLYRKMVDGGSELVIMRRGVPRDTNI